jgi:hypothetical protein
MAIVTPDMFASHALATRIDRAEMRLSMSIAETVTARTPSARALVTPIAGGQAVFSGAGSPANKAIGVGFGATIDEAALDAIEQAWTAWALGGSSNALLAEDFCGEIVEGKFFLTVTIGSGATELDCTIPSGMQAVASPFGAFSWAPTDGKTGTKLFNATFGYLKGVVPKAVKVVVDGSTLPKGPMLCSQPFDISLEPGNSLQQLDPNVKGDSTKVVTCGWFYLVGPLSPGSHTIAVLWKGELEALLEASKNRDQK